MGFRVYDLVIFWSGIGRICTVFKYGWIFGSQLNYILVRDWKDLHSVNWRDLHCAKILLVFELMTELYFG